MFVHIDVVHTELFILLRSLYSPHLQGCSQKGYFWGPTPTSLENVFHLLEFLEKRVKISPPKNFETPNFKEKKIVVLLYTLVHEIHMWVYIFNQHNFKS